MSHSSTATVCMRGKGITKKKRHKVDRCKDSLTGAVQYFDKNPFSYDSLLIVKNLSFGRFHCFCRVRIVQSSFHRYSSDE